MEKLWTVLDLIQWTTGFLKQKGIENGRREAEDLLGHVLELDRLKLYLAFENHPSPTELKIFRDLVARRGKREPLQYLLGWQPFLGMKIKCDPRALIPRPETEALAQVAIQELKNSASNARFADIGTGTACIALALLKNSEAQGVASDLSPEALELARENAEAQELQNRLQFVLGNGTEALQGEFDLIVSNPPYIAMAERDSLQAEVRDYEPAQALFADEDGLKLLRELIQGAPKHLKAGAWLMLECGKGHPQLLQTTLSKDWAETRIEKDPYGIDRFLLARKA
jgi:release factor glutamine methyltransferase